MVCIHCGEKTHVTNSRLQRRNNQIWRRRQCFGCKAVFTTLEAADYTSSWTVNTKSGVIEPFNRDKLFLSLHNSCQHRKTALRDASALVDTIVQKLQPLIYHGTVDRTALRQIIQVALNRFDKAASVHYAAFHTD